MLLAEISTSDVGPWAAIGIGTMSLAGVIITAMIQFGPRRRGKMEMEQTPHLEDQLDHIQTTVSELQGEMKRLKSEQSRSGIDITDIRTKMEKHADKVDTELTKLREMMLRLLRENFGGQVKP